MIGMAVACKGSELAEKLAESIGVVTHSQLKKLCEVNENRQWLKPIPYVLTEKAGTK